MFIRIIILLLVSSSSFGQINFNLEAPDDYFVDVFVLAGQSNTGRPLTTAMTSEQQALYAGNRANTWIFNPFVSTTSFDTLNAGQNCYTEGADIRQFGPEASLFKLLQDYNSRERYLMKFGIGGTSMQNVWRPLLTNFNNIVKHLDSTFSLIIAQGKTPRLVAVIWMQGETDAISLTNSNLYYSNLVNFHNTLRSKIYDLTVKYSLPEFLNYKVINYRIKPNPDVSYAYASTVRAAQELYCANFGAKLLNTDDLTFFDDEHFDATSQIEIGNRIFQIVKDL